MLSNGLVWAVPSSGRWGCSYVSINSERRAPQLGIAYGGRTAILARTNALGTS
jgi:hypothetical protein